MNKIKAQDLEQRTQIASINKMIFINLSMKYQNNISNAPITPTTPLRSELLVNLLTPLCNLLNIPSLKYFLLSLYSGLNI